MFAFLTKLLLVARSRLKSRASLEAENLVLRQQVIVLSRKSRSRVRLRNIDRLIFVWLYRFFPATLNANTVVKPETGSAADPRRTADARDRGRPINRGEVHDQKAGATLPGLEDIPAQPCRWDRVHRFVRGSYNLF